MQGSKRIFKNSIAVLSVFLSTQALAVCSLPNGYYAEANIGGTKFYGQTLPTGFTGSTSGKAWSVFGGYKFTPFVGAEAGFTRYAPTRLQNPAIGPGNLAQIQHTTINVATKLMYPIQDSGFEPFAKIGVGNIQSYVNHIQPILVGSYNTGSQRSKGLYWAAGMAYYFTPNFGTNIQYAQARGNSNTGTPAAYTVGLNFIFTAS